jgi:hypothetical protein
MNLDSLEGIVDPSRLGADSRVSFSQDPSSVTLHGAWDDVPESQHQRPAASSINNQHQNHSNVHLHAQGHAVGSTESWFDTLPHASNGAAMANLPPPISASTFTNPFAPGSNGSFATNKRRRNSLILMLNAPTSGVALQADATGMHTTTISPTNPGGPDDPTSPSWVAPESWAVKRQDGDEDAASMSGESEDNLQMQEPARNVVNQDDNNSLGHDMHSTIGRQGSLQVNVGGEYKIRVINETGGAPYAVFKVPYTETAQSFIKTKFYAKALVDAEYRLWIQDRGRGANCVYSGKRFMMLTFNR